MTPPLTIALVDLGLMLLAGLSLVAWWRRPTTQRLDVLFTIGTLGGFIAIPWTYLLLDQTVPAGATLVSSILLLLHPLAFYRLVGHLDERARRHRAPVAIAAGFALVLFLITASNPHWSVSAGLLAYMLTASGLGAFYLVTGAQQRQGMNRIRMEALAAAVVLTMSALAFAAVAKAFGVAAVIVDEANGLMGLAVLGAFYIGVAPPAAIRRSSTAAARDKLQHRLDELTKLDGKTLEHDVLQPIRSLLGACCVTLSITDRRWAHVVGTTELHTHAPDAATGSAWMRRASASACPACAGRARGDFPDRVARRFRYGRGMTPPVPLVQTLRVANRAVARLEVRCTDEPLYRDEDEALLESLIQRASLRLEALWQARTMAELNATLSAKNTLLAAHNAELEAAEREVRSLLAATPDAVLMIDIPRDRVKIANRAAQRLLELIGYRRDNTSFGLQEFARVVEPRIEDPTLASAYAEIAAQQDPAAVPQMARQILSVLEEEPFETRIGHSLMEVELRVARITAAGTRWLIMVRDLQGQREREQDHLVQNQREHYERRLHALESVVTGVAHEVLNPLTAAQNSLYVMQRAVEKSSSARREPGLAAKTEGMEALHAAVSDVDAGGSALDPWAELDAHDAKMLKLVERVTNQLGRISDIVAALGATVRRAAPARPMIALDRLVDDALNGLAELAQAKGVSLAPPRVDDPVVCRGDPSRILAAAHALIKNAIEWTPPGTTVRTFVDYVEGRPTLRVIDLGPGISAEEANQVFDPFFTTRDDAFGLGLTLVETVAYQHGGDVRLAAGPGGRGTEVRFSLGVTSTPTEHPGIASLDDLQRRRSSKPGGPTEVIDGPSLPPPSAWSQK